MTASRLGKPNKGRIHSSIHPPIAVLSTDVSHYGKPIDRFDRILVMDAASGRAVGFGSPRDLMQIEGGVFRSFVQERGERRAPEEIIWS